LLKRARVALLSDPSGPALDDETRAPADHSLHVALATWAFRQRIILDRLAALETTAA
jgi:hypothetical protein